MKTLVVTLRCSCGQWWNFSTTREDGQLSRSGQALAKLFRHFHEGHGGVVTETKKEEE